MLDADRRPGRGLGTRGHDLARGREDLAVRGQLHHQLATHHGQTGAQLVETHGGVGQPGARCAAGARGRGQVAVGLTHAQFARGVPEAEERSVVIHELAGPAAGIRGRQATVAGGDAGQGPRERFGGRAADEADPTGLGVVAELGAGRQSRGQRLVAGPHTSAADLPGLPATWIGSGDRRRSEGGRQQQRQQGEHQERGAGAVGERSGRGRGHDGHYGTRRCVVPLPVRRAGQGHRPRAPLAPRTDPPAACVPGQGRTTMSRRVATPCASLIV